MALKKLDTAVKAGEALGDAVTETRKALEKHQKNLNSVCDQILKKNAKVGAACGAEISDVDLSAPLDDATFAAIDTMGTDAAAVAGVVSSAGLGSDAPRTRQPSGVAAASAVSPADASASALRRTRGVSVVRSTASAEVGAFATASVSGGASLQYLFFYQSQRLEPASVALLRSKMSLIFFDFRFTCLRIYPYIVIY